MHVCANRLWRSFDVLPIANTVARFLLFANFRRLLLITFFWRLSRYKQMLFIVCFYEPLRFA